MRPLMQMRDDGIVEAGELAEVFHFTANDFMPVGAEAAGDMAREGAAEIALVEPSGDAAIAQGVWQAAAELPEEEAGGPSFVEAIVVAALPEEPLMSEESPAAATGEASPRKSAARPAGGRRPAHRKKAAPKPVKRKTAPPAKKHPAKTKKAAPKKKPGGKKAPRKKKAVKKSPAKKKSAKKKPAKKR